MGANQPDDTSRVSILVYFWKFLRTYLVEETTFNLCSELFGVGFIKLTCDGWTPNSRQPFRVPPPLRVSPLLRSHRWLPAGLCLGRFRLFHGVIALQAARI